MKKIFIVGVAHSGTTILYKMLAYHPDLCWFCQFSQRNGKIPGRMNIPLLYFYKRNLRKLFPHQWKKGSRKIWIPRPGEANSIINYIVQIENLENRKKILQDVIEDELMTWNKESIIIKNPNLGLHLSWLNQTFPDDSYFVHIIRDGRAVILSLLHKYLRYHGEDMAIENAIQYWKTYMLSVSESKKILEMKNLLEIRYEDFIDNIHSNIKKIFYFCNLDDKEYDFSKIPKSLKSTNTRWINDQNSDKIKMIEERAVDYLKYWKYIEK